MSSPQGSHLKVLRRLKDRYKTKEITDAIVFMICKDNIPVRCFEKEGFKNLLKKCITSMIEEKYAECVGRLKKISSTVEDVAFTCDAVTIPNSSRSFLTVTAHFLHKESLNLKGLKWIRIVYI